MMIHKDLNLTHTYIVYHRFFVLSLLSPLSFQGVVEQDKETHYCSYT